MEEQRATIWAKNVWNPTGIYLEESVAYRFSAKGCWADCCILHGPSGDPSGNSYMKLFEKWKRLPDRNWFELIGAVDRDINSAFPIGDGVEYTSQKAGQLTCFANDVRGFYFNNHGRVALSVVRVV